MMQPRWGCESASRLQLGSDGVADVDGFGGAAQGARMRRCTQQGTAYGFVDCDGLKAGFDRLAAGDAVRQVLRPHGTTSP